MFLFGSCPPREGTTIEKARETCMKFTNRSAVLATDGFIVYDIQDEGGRTTTERPFPFRKTMEPSLYASFFREATGKQCIVYKSVVESSVEDFDNWVDGCVSKLGHTTFNLVGAPSSSQAYAGPNLTDACKRIQARTDCDFGCVCIPERHTKKNNEHINMFNKASYGAQWFITQGIFSAPPLIRLLTDYAVLCRSNGVTPKKVVLTFAPCGRAKTMTFIKWLGMHVPEEVETHILTAANPCKASCDILCVILKEILEGIKGAGVPIGINVESLSIFKEEIDGAHELFQRLQAILLNSYGSPWSVKWFFVTPSEPDAYSVDLGLSLSRATSPSQSMASLKLLGAGDEAGEKAGEVKTNEKADTVKGTPVNAADIKLAI